MLPSSILSRLDALTLAMRARTGGTSGGARASRALGTSAEFSDFREYAPGDDLRRVDWNAYARFDRLFLKLFTEERETRVNVLVDASRSMAFGESAKWRMAAQVAETLCYLALRGGDRVSLYILRGGEAVAGPRLSGRAGSLTAGEYLDSILPNGETALNAAVRRLNLYGQRGLTILISDLLDEAGCQTALQSLLFQKQETSVIQILSREEMSPDYTGATRLCDMESRREMDVMMNAETLARYDAALQAFLGDMRAFCVKRGIGYTLIQSDASLEQALLRDMTRAGIVS